LALQSHWFSYIVQDGRARLEWGSNPRFTPEERVLSVWREAARVHTGREPEVEFVVLATAGLVPVSGVEVM
jgi:hypothetical protein